MDNATIFFWAFIGAGTLGIVVYVLIHMHHHGHGCCARRPKKPDVEQGCALPDVQSSHQSSKVTLVDAVVSAPEPNMTEATDSTQLNPVNAPVGVSSSESTDTVANEVEVQRRREPRCFGGKKDLEPLQLANLVRNDGDVSVRSASITRQNRGEQLKEADIGAVKLPQSAR